MEFVEGQTLKDKIAAGPLPLREALQTTVEISEALEKAHERGIVHRDLKPANIMITAGGHAKGMDFGLAKRVVQPESGDTQEETLTSLTGEGATLGTSPIRRRNRRARNRRMLDPTSSPSASCCTRC